ncbi:integrase arm-type DNA-binding domain-containing protein [uncultured Desulfovibrio sp.]|uniref:tyrosine-type recombinase/integrase n=1 Tax=uncultured Desulfovibrio sp. TaxID=167968 RepID=UPI00262E7DA3|nr:integrase arm-type DNA-binding domain-containing protein [uncultured Desulfovibrio sp.]
MLDERVIQSLKAADKPKKYADGGGLFLFIPVSGKKLWRMAYRFERKAKLLTFGEYPQVSLLAARQKRDEAKALIKAGLDPAERKKAERKKSADISFRSIALEWHGKETAHCRKKYRGFMLNNLEKYFFPVFGDKPLPEVEADDIMRAIEPLRESGMLRGGRRLTDICGQICRYAVATGKTAKDPTKKLPIPYRSKQAGHKSATIDEKMLGQIMVNLDRHEGYFPVKCALRLVPLLLVRSGELRCAKWPEFDLSRKLWIIPACRSHQPYDHIVPLAPQAIIILKELREYSGQGHLLFPGVKSPENPIDMSTITVSLRRRGYGDVKLSFDGFRQIAPRILASRGHEPAIVGTQLVQRGGQKSKFDPWQFLSERQAMMRDWAEYLYLLKDKAVSVKSQMEGRHAE